MPRSGRFGSSSLAALEALAYDGASRSSTPSSCGHANSSKTSPAIGHRKHSRVNRDGPNASKLVAWGWESRLREAEEDLRQLQRRTDSSKSSIASTDAVAAAIADQDASESRACDVDRLAQEADEHESVLSYDVLRSRSTQKLRDNSQPRALETRSEAEKRPGFGDRWASSVLFDECPDPQIQSLKEALQKSLEREALLKSRLEEAERDKDNVCRLWDEDRAKMLGMKRTVECAFLSAQTELKNRLASRNANVRN